MSATPSHPFCVVLFCPLRDWFCTASWQMCGDLPTLFYWGFTSSHDTRSWSMERNKCHESWKFKSFHVFTQSFQSPSGCSMWQPTENSLCKINSFQHVSHAKLPSTPASGKCGHQLPYEQIHRFVWWAHTFICWHILYTICKAASASLDVTEQKWVYFRGCVWLQHKM